MNEITYQAVAEGALRHLLVCKHEGNMTNEDHAAFIALLGECDGADATHEERQVMEGLGGWLDGSADTDEAIIVVAQLVVRLLGDSV